jgi:hypothetical protein
MTAYNAFINKRLKNNTPSARFWKVTYTALWIRWIGGEALEADISDAARLPEPWHKSESKYLSFAQPTNLCLPFIVRLRG